MRMRTSTTVLSMSALASFMNMATGRVSVFIAIDPATVMVAPNSPKAFAHVRMPEAMMPRLARGKRNGKKSPCGRGAEGLCGILVPGRYLVHSSLDEARGDTHGGDELSQEYAIYGKDDLNASLLHKAAGRGIEEDKDEGA